MQEVLLHKGERQFGEVSAALAALHQQLGAQRNRVGSLRSAVVDAGAARDEVYQLARDLMQERAKVTALEGELSKPLNVHRWRKLEGKHRS